MAVVEVSLTVQILAMGLTISQLITQPVTKFRKNFNPGSDQPAVTKILHDGCREGLKEDDSPDAKMLEIDPILESFEKEAGSAPSIKAPTGPGGAAPTAAQGLESKVAKFDFKALRIAYKQFCLAENIANSPIDLKEVITYYNTAFEGVPSVDILKNYRFEQATQVLDADEHHFSDIYSKGNRRKFVPISSLPAHVIQAFVSAEDKDFYKHKGFDMRGILRAAFSAMESTEGKRAAGGSTITQQMIKNVYHAADYTFPRKMREMFMASEADATLSKARILELYLNSIPFGRGTNGIEMAAQVWFKKSATQLTRSEAALLAGTIKGPSLYNPDKRPDLVEKRRQYVLGRMIEDAFDTSSLKYKDPIRLRVHRKQARAEVAKLNEAKALKWEVVPVERAKAYYSVDQINRQIRMLAKKSPALADYEKGGYVVNSTIDPQIQTVAERAIQDGLAQYEASNGSAVFKGAVGSLEKRIAISGKTWKEILPDVKADVYYDVYWPLAVVLTGTPDDPKSCGTKLAVGVRNGSVSCLDAGKYDVSVLKAMDLVFVRRDRSNPKTVKLLIPPTVQGSMVILENATGRVLGMVGGFSYGASQLNRVTMTERPPGSTIKPFLYLYAFNKNFQPNTLISDSPKVIAPVVPGGHPWSPKNYDGQSGGMVPLRVGLENSLNIAAANTMAGIDTTPALGMLGMCQLTQDLGIYPKLDENKKPIGCMPEFPFVLGAQTTRLIDMAQAYATIANLGLRPPTPYLVDSILRDDKIVWERRRFGLKPVSSADRVSFFQLRRVMEGVVQRGTAASLAAEFGAKVMPDGRLGSTLIGAKTGTSQKENDAWFIGFSEKYTVATWVGHDNATRATRRTLAKGSTGGKTAMPIALQVFRYIKATRGMKPLSGPPKDIMPWLAEARVDQRSGQFSNNGNFVETFRRESPNGPIVNTWSALTKPEDLAQSRGQVQVSNPTGDGDDTAAAANDGNPSSDDSSAPTERRYESPQDQYYKPTQDDEYTQQPRNRDRGYEAMQRQFQGF